MQTLERNSLIDNLSELKFAKVILQLIIIKDLHSNCKDPESYEIELGNFFGLLENFASEQSNYEHFCSLRDELLDNLGLAINDLKAASKQKDLSEDKQKFNKELLKIANKFFTQIVALRD